MDKQVLEQFIQHLNNAGIIEYSVRFENGNRVITHNSETSRIYLNNDYLVGIETKNNNGINTKGVFNVKAIPYDNIENAMSTDLTVSELIKFLGEEGIELDEDLTKFIKERGGRVILRPGTGELGVLADENEDPIFLPGSVPKVTVGAELKTRKSDERDV